MALTSTGRKSKTSGGKASKRKAVKNDRCKSAYTFFSSYGCASVNCSGTNLGEASRLKSEAWHGLSAAERAPYDAGARLDRGRRDLEKLRARAARDAQKVSVAVKEAASALMGLQPPTPTWLGHLADEAIAALEALDRRMDPAVRAVVGAGLGTAISTPAAAASARRALGGQQGERLWAMLRRWAIARAAPAAPAGGADRPARSAPKKAAAASVAAAEPLTEDVRQKVVGALMRTCASSAGRASIGTCRGIEQELFARLGSTPKEYRLRARSLLFNLRATDGILLGKVLAGSLPPSELVCLGTEELANDALKAQRKVERERYFRSEVHLAHGLPPPRRRRSSLQLRPGDAAEHAADEPGADAAAQGEPRRLRRRRSLAEPGAGPGAAPGAEGARSAKRRRSSTGPRVGDGGALLAPADAAGATGASAQAGGAVLALADAATGPSVGNGGGISDGSSGSDSDSGSLSDSLSDSPSGGSSGSSSGSSESASSGGSEESAESDDSKENQAGAVQQLPGGGCRQVVLPLLERA